MRPTGWTILALVLVAAVAALLRFGTDVRTLDARFDEKDIRVPIDDIIARGWSVETAIDFEETKGPALIWPYALLGGALGGSLNDLRLVSVLFFVAGAWPLLLLARDVGVRGPAVLGGVGLLVLLPYHATLGQLVMSEASFIFGGLWLMVCVLRGLAARGPSRIAWIVAYAALLAVLMHHRVHAVAFAGAACLVALERDGRSSWPWWLASIAAGLARLPLWLRWGGLVSPYYQGMFGLGISVEAAVYLGAALPLVTAVFLVPLVLERDRAGLAAALAVGGLAAGLGLVFAPDLAQTLVRDGAPTPRFAGVVKTGVTTIFGSGSAARVATALGCGLGVAGLAALALQAWRRDAREHDGAAWRLLSWTLAGGCALYLLTRSMVFDRYLLVWSILAPLAWMRLLPRWAAVLQGIVLAAAGMWFVRAWLMA